MDHWGIILGWACPGEDRVCMLIGNYNEVIAVQECPSHVGGCGIDVACYSDCMVCVQVRRPDRLRRVLKGEEGGCWWVGDWWGELGLLMARVLKGEEGAADGSGMDGENLGLLMARVLMGEEGELGHLIDQEEDLVMSVSYLRCYQPFLCFTCSVWLRSISWLLMPWRRNGQYHGCWCPGDASVNIMAADALAASVARSSAAIILAMSIEDVDMLEGGEAGGIWRL